MLHLRSARQQIPAEPLLNELHEMAGHLDMSNIRGMPLRTDIVVLHDARGVEVMHEPLRLIRPRHLLDLVDERASLCVARSHGAEPIPQADQHDLRTRPHLVHVGHEVDVGLQVRAGRDVVVRVVVVGPEVDDDDVGGGMRAEVPGLGGVAVELGGAPRRVGGVVPLVRLPARVAPAVGVDEADARVRGDAEFGAAQAFAEAPRVRGQAFVGRVLAGGEGVADDLERAWGERQADQGAGGGGVDVGDLDAVGPVGDAQLEGAGGGVGEVEARGCAGDEGVGGVGGHIGELPVLPIETVADEDAWSGVFAEGDGDTIAGEAEFEAGSAVGGEFRPFMIP